MLPLKNIKILDVSRLLPGSFCSYILSSLGAEVVKIEEPGVGDYYRAITHSDDFIGPGQFEALNYNKKSLVLNLKTTEGRHILHQLIPQYDIVIEGFRPKVVGKIGLDYPTLKKIHPKIIVGSITGYGQSGPLKDEAGHDLNYLSYSGVLSLTGPLNRPPVIPGAQIADVGGGALYAVIGIIAALYRRDKTGQGAHLDISMTEGALSIVGSHYLESILSKKNILWGQAPLSGGLARYRVYEAKDHQHVALAALEPKFWFRFCEIIKKPEWGPLEFRGQGLGKRREKILERVFHQKTAQEWAEIGKQEDICLSLVWKLNDLHNHPQHHFRRVFYPVRMPSGRKARIVLSPIRMTDMPRSRPKSFPKLGAHTREILLGMGYKSKDLSRLKKEGIIG